MAEINLPPGRVFQEGRRQLGLSTASLSRLAGVPVGHIRSFEAGDGNLPKESILKALQFIGIHPAKCGIELDEVGEANQVKTDHLHGLWLHLAIARNHQTSDPGLD